MTQTVIPTQEQTTPIPNPQEVTTPQTKPETPTTTSPIEKVKPVFKPKVIEKPVVVEQVVETFKDKMAKVHQAGSFAVRAIINSLNDYVDKMNPKVPTTPEKVSMNQYLLYTAIKAVVENPNPADFKECWVVCLAYYQEYGNKDQPMHPYAINRNPEAWTRSVEELDALMSMNNLLRQTSNPDTRRAVVSRINLDLAIGVYFNDIGRRNILSFYA